MCYEWMYYKVEKPNTTLKEPLMQVAGNNGFDKIYKQDEPISYVNPKNDGTSRKTYSHEEYNRTIANVRIMNKKLHRKTP